MVRVNHDSIVLSRPIVYYPIPSIGVKETMQSQTLVTSCVRRTGIDCFYAMRLKEQKTEARSKVGGCKAQTMSKKVVGLFVCLLVWLEAGKGEEGGGGTMKRWMCVCGIVVYMQSMVSIWRLDRYQTGPYPVPRPHCSLHDGLISHRYIRETYVRKSAMRRSRFMPWQDVF